MRSRLDAAGRPELVALIKENGVRMTLCPWAYMRHPYGGRSIQVYPHAFRSGIKVNISSDSPAYVESNCIIQTLLLMRIKCGFTDEEIARVEKDSVEMCWASEEVKGV